MDISTPPRVAARLVEAHPSHLMRHVDCPFCGATHAHGETLGHRNSHCLDYHPARGQKVDPRDVRGNHGYILCDPDDSEVNWAAEKLRGSLFVLRNKYRRLLAEWASMIPLGARETRVKANTKAQADAIAEVLVAAGVSL